jgi:hypothetical protein
MTLVILFRKLIKLLISEFVFSLYAIITNIAINRCLDKFYANQ